MKSELSPFRLTDRATTVADGGTGVYTFDLEGRPVSWWDGTRTYKRSLASAVHVRHRAASRRTYTVLEGSDAARCFATLLDRVRRVRPSRPEERARLDRISAWSPETLLAERERFEAAYAPISILPPDQYLSVVLQATFGCSWNKCTFCDFYQGRPFRARATDEIDHHLRSVRALLGRGVALRRSVFLADGNALILANDRLVPILERARAAFPGLPVAGFLDVYVGERKPDGDWSALRELGLRMVHVGIESGHDPLLAWMNKPAKASETVALTSTLKAAGLRVGAIFMVGAGGAPFEDGHVRDTISLIDRLPLEPGDLVYLSPFVEHEGSEYARRARSEGVRPLDERALERQFAVLYEAVRRRHPSVRVARYDLREFLY